MQAPAFWQHRGPLSFLLLPLSGLYRLLAAVKGHRDRARAVRLPVPVVIVGNISVGGTGKTPLLIALARRLQKAGFRPGIVSRGYGVELGPSPREVTESSTPQTVGDEPLMLARATGLPVVVHPDRPAAAKLLLVRHDCDLILSDDGLQHYRLARDVEIAVIDGRRRLGNGHCLPAGPLREPPARLQAVDFVVANGGSPAEGEFAMRLAVTGVRNLHTGEVRPLSAFRGQRVHAVAGIGHPARFFASLEAAGLTIVPHAFADHHDFAAADLDFADADAVLMTEKDAVKCGRFASSRMWCVCVEAWLEERLVAQLINQLKGVMNHGSTSAGHSRLPGHQGAADLRQEER